jgi:DNA-binding MarR family transcriptional regulator
MEKLLLEFINTLDLSLKKLNKETKTPSGFSALTVSQLQYIDAISSLEDATITAISEKLRITKASVTVGVNKLISLGYVTKTRSKDDKRVFYVSLTRAGGKLVDAKYQALQTYGAFIRSALTKEESQQFETILTKLVGLFEKN